jgi:hypothetical protein
MLHRNPHAVEEVSMPFMILLLSIPSILQQHSAAQFMGKHAQRSGELAQRDVEDDQGIARHRVIEEWLQRYGLFEKEHRQAPDGRSNWI